MSYEMKKHVFDFCYGMAVNDAMNRVSGLKAGDKGNLFGNKDIQDRMYKYVSDIVDGNSYDFYIVVKCIENINAKSKEKVECLNFGKIQKLVNMTIKYFYINYYNTEFRKNFSDCGAPMDSYMIKFVFDNYYEVKKTNKRNGDIGFKRDLGWSTDNNNQETYKHFQEAIDVIIEEKELGINRIEFDYMFWDEARKNYGGKNKKNDR